MPNAWNGADPVEASDPQAYELGTRWRANGDITITHIRVWTGAGETSIANRRGRVWSAAGGQLGIASLPNDLPEGWSQHALDTPVEITSGTGFVTSYSTGGNEGALAGALIGDVISADGLVTAVAAASVPPGNGRYSLTPGSFPDTGSGSQAFYGADFVYTAGLGGNTAPRITQATAVPSGPTVTTTVVAEDDEGLTTATYRFVWGDGQPDTVTTHPTNFAQHTYASSGTYAQLVSVTDADGLSDFAALAAEVHVPDPAITDLGLSALRDALLTHAKTIGGIHTAAGHEPLKGPERGNVHLALWFDGLTPVPAVSGLAATSVRVGWIARLYIAADGQKLDDVETRLSTLADRLLAAYSGDFSLGGRVRNVDLLGAHGPALSCQFGYQRFENGIFRVATVALPLIVNNVWEQVA